MSVACAHLDSAGKHAQTANCHVTALQADNINRFEGRAFADAIRLAFALDDQFAGDAAIFTDQNAIAPTANCYVPNERGCLRQFNVCYHYQRVAQLPSTGRSRQQYSRGPNPVEPQKVYEIVVLAAT